jgi:hypothetical protein
MNEENDRGPKIHLDPEVTRAVNAVFHPEHICIPRYFGPGAGIRCRFCNAKIAEDPRVAATAASPSPNPEAVLAAVAARGARCDRCGHWTYRDAARPEAGRPPVRNLCRNCSDLGNGEPRLTRLTGWRETPHRKLTQEQVWYLKGQRYQGDPRKVQPPLSMAEIAAALRENPVLRAISEEHRQRSEGS